MRHQNGTKSGLGMLFSLAFPLFILQPSQPCLGGWDPSHGGRAPSGLPSTAHHCFAPCTAHLCVCTWSCLWGGGAVSRCSQHTLGPTGHSHPPDLKSMLILLGEREECLNQGEGVVPTTGPSPRQDWDEDTAQRVYIENVNPCETTKTQGSGNSQKCPGSQWTSHKPWNYGLKLTSSWLGVGKI